MIQKYIGNVFAKTLQEIFYTIMRKGREENGDVTV